MLRAEVVEAAMQDRFHIYSVRHVDQALELLTGQSAGVPDSHGLYPADSINGQIQERLAELFRVRQKLNFEARGEDRS
jgi:predicted ATP-dependent protease